MKYRLLFAASLMLAPSLATAEEDYPAGVWRFSRDESIASLLEAGKSKQDAENTADMSREMTIEFTEETVKIDLTAGFTVAKCGWDSNENDSIILTDCVDGDGKPVAEAATGHIDWMDDGSLYVIDKDGSKVVFRR